MNRLQTGRQTPERAEQIDRCSSVRLHSQPQGSALTLSQPQSALVGALREAGALRARLCLSLLHANPIKPSLLMRFVSIERVNS